MKMKVMDLSLGDLLLDEENPRLPETLEKRGQDELTRYIANEYNTVEVARSIAEHGYFDSEPLIAIKKKDKYIIVEGNRRLTALKILSDPELRESLDLDEGEEWDRIAGDVDLDDIFPVHVAKNRREVAPIIGFRHIAGIEPWEPWAKARFIARQIEEENLTFEETARIVGERETEVRSQYRNYRLATDAEEKLKIPADQVKAKFGFFTRAMNSVGLRQHIGAPAPNEVAKNKAVLKPSKKDEVAELFSWLFGDAEHKAVISDSRQISALGDVVSSDEALKVLRATRQMDEALLASGGVRDRLRRRLAAARTALEKAELDIATFRDDADVQGDLERCAEALARLQAKGDA
jgi:hypothetical protein